MISSRAIHTQTVIAKQDIKAHRFVDFEGLMATTSTSILGVSTTSAQMGDALGVMVIGTAIVEATGPIATGDNLKSDANGLALKDDTGSFFALSQANVKGDIIKVLLR